MYSSWYSCQILMKLFLEKILEKYSNIKFHEYSLSGSQVVSCKWMDGQTNMMKLTVTFRNLVNAPINSQKFPNT